MILLKDKKKQALKGMLSKVASCAKCDGKGGCGKKMDGKGGCKK